MKISVVMPSFNQGPFLEAAILSLIEQDYAEKELIFIDGGSTDDTMEIFEKYKHHFAYFVSKKDSGQSEALQTGFDQATGDILTWLNTDDLLLPGVLKQVEAEFSADPDVECVFGNVVWINSEDVIMRCRKGGDIHPFLTKLGRLTPFGPSAFFKASTLQRHGGINFDLHYTMDTELWWRFCREGVKFSRLTDYAWAFRRYPQSKTSGYLFNASPDYRSNPVYQCERQHIHALKKGYCLPGSMPFGRPLEFLMRGTSRRYLKGLLDSYSYKGRDLRTLLK